MEVRKEEGPGSINYSLKLEYIGIHQNIEVDHCNYNLNMMQYRHKKDTLNNRVILLGDLHKAGGDVNKKRKECKQIQK